MKTLSLLCLCTFGFHFLNASATVTTPPSNFVTTIDIVEALGEITYHMENGTSKNKYYTRDGEFHWEASGPVIALEINGQIVGQNEVDDVMLPSGTEVMVDFSTSGEAYLTLL